jgi:hypothetical protein
MTCDMLVMAWRRRLRAELVADQQDKDSCECVDYLESLTVGIVGFV